MPGNDSYTKLLMHYNGVDGSKEVLDDGATGHIVTQVGTAKLVSGRFNNCGYFNGTTSKLSIPDHADFDLSANFTIDFWVKFDALTAGMWILSKGNHNTYNPFELAEAAGSMKLYMSSDGANWDIANAKVVITTLVAGVWYHVAVTRSGDDYYTFCDGVQTATWNVAKSPVVNASTVVVGSTSNAAGVFFRGYIDEFRILKGTAAWAAAFTPPYAAYSGSDIPDEGVLLHLDGNVTDSGSTVHTVTNTAVGFTPKFGSSCLALDGDSDYITAPDHADWDLMSPATITNYTMDCWVQFTSVVSAGIAEQYVGADDYWRISVAAGVLYLVSETGASINISINGGTVVANTWYHIAIIRVGNLYGLYVNGTQVAYVSYATSRTYASTLRIGYNQKANYYLNGNMDEFRVQHSNYFNAAPVVGLTDTITIPTSAHTADADTKLLLPMNTQDVSLSHHIPTYVGTAQLDTAQKEFGTGSLLLDGDSDYITFPDHVDWDLGTGAFTIDFWVRWAATSGADTFLASTTFGATTFLYTVTHTSWEVEMPAGGYIGASDWTPNLNQWYHIALVGNGAANGSRTLKVYIDGTLSGDALTYDYNIVVASTVYIGASGEPGNYFNGWIDEFRISKGIQRWIANFTPPTREYDALGLICSKAIII